MRELKFRAWREDLQIMSSPFKLFDNDEYYLLNGDAMDVEDAVVMQYTGQKDKNGKEIYERDIIFSSHIEDQKAGPVKWSDIHHAYIINYPRRKGDATDQWQFMHGKEHCYEVIGDIYRSPELLK
jgi:uncharacterized phage protein (TIGR01671 family)